MADFININTDILKNDVSQMQACVESAIRNLEDTIDAISHLNSMWQGTANTAFKNEASIDHMITKTYLEGLKRFLDCMKEDAREYDTCENKAIEMVNSIRI